MSEEVRPSRLQRPAPRPRYFWAYMQRRRTYLWLAVVLLVVVVILLVYSWPQPDWGRNLALNLSADLIGTIIVLFTVSPLLARAENQGDHVRDSFDRGAFIRQAADARRQILILELWTDEQCEHHQKRQQQRGRAAVPREVRDAARARLRERAKHHR